MIVADKCQFSPIFEEWAKRNAPPEKQHFTFELFAQFWQPEPPPGFDVHPLELVLSFWKKGQDKTISSKPVLLFEHWEDANSERIRELQSMSASEESLYWHNETDKEWASLSEKTEAYLAQAAWGHNTNKADKFLEFLEREFLFYKKTALRLFARRRTTELVRDAHLYRDFGEIKKIIRQWLMPDWETTAFMFPLISKSYTAHDRSQDYLPNNRAISPMNYLGALGGKHVLTATGFETGMSNDVSYLADVFLRKVLESQDMADTWNRWTYTPMKPDGWSGTEMGSALKTGRRIAHEMFTEVFSAVGAKESHKEKTGFWLTAPNAECLQMWLDLETEFREHMSNILHELELIPSDQQWGYYIQQNRRTSDSAPVREKVDTWLRLAVKFKDTMPENYLHWESLLSSDIYKLSLKSLSDPMDGRQTSVALNREYLLRYGLNWPFITSELPCTKGTFSMPFGIKLTPGLALGSYVTTVPIPADEELLENELQWQVGAADMRVQAGVTTPDMELEELLSSLEWLGKKERDIEKKPSHFQRFYSYGHPEGHLKEPWYLHLHSAYTQKWGCSEKMWNEKILNHGIYGSGRVLVRSITQHWLSPDQWAFYQYMKQDGDLDKNVIEILNTAYTVFKGNKEKMPLRISSMAGNNGNSLESMFPERKGYIEHLGKGVDFIRFNVIANEVRSATSLLKDLSSVPEDEPTDFILRYIFDKLSDRYSNTMCEDVEEGVTFSESIKAVVRTLELEAREVLDFSTGELTGATDFNHIGF